MFAFVVLGLISSVVSQGIGWEDRFQNVEWDSCTCAKLKFYVPLKA